MKSSRKKLLGALVALAVLWALAFAAQETVSANLRGDNRIEARPMIQGLTRLRPVKEEHLAYAPEIPGAYLEYYADEKGLELPRGWQPPGTEELAEVWREGRSWSIGPFRIGKWNTTTATSRFDEPPYEDSYVRLAKVTTPSLRRVTCKAYLFGVFPIKGVREGYLLYSNIDFGATIKAYHEGNTAGGHYPVMWVDGPNQERVHMNYISTRDSEALAQAIITGEGLEALVCPLYADTPDSEILRVPTKLFFP